MALNGKWGNDRNEVVRTYVSVQWGMIKGQVWGMVNDTLTHNACLSDIRLAGLPRDDG